MVELLGKSAIQIEVEKVQSGKDILVQVKQEQRDDKLLFVLTDSIGHREFVWYNLTNEDGCYNKKSIDGVVKNLFVSYAYKHGIEVIPSNEKASNKTAKKNKLLLKK